MARTAQCCMVVTTCASRRQAQVLGRTVVKARLAACAQLEPISSIYRWEGKVCCDDEWRVTMKTTRAGYRRLEAFVRARHSYSVPQIVAVPFSAGSAAYLRWVRQSVGGA